MTNNRGNYMMQRQQGMDSMRRMGNGCGCNSARNQSRGGKSCGMARNTNQSRCGCNQNNSNNVSTQCCKLMRRLQVLDFSINELVLYLDVYPDCRRALEHFHRLRCEREQVIKEYEELCGPVRAIGNESTQEWDWIKNPWPWEVDFPGNDKGQL